jgi:hypothetical protein
MTATLLKYRQHYYDNLSKISKYFLPMLISNRRELRHGALECFTVICSYFNTYKPITPSVLETNQSIKLIFSLVENLSYDALNALRFRLQRNSLPSLTDEGNITPGLVCDSTTMNDPDAKFILLVNTPAQTPQPTTATKPSTPTTTIEPSTPPTQTKMTPRTSTEPSTPTTQTKMTPPTTNKLLQLAMPFAASTTKTNTNDPVSLFILIEIVFLYLLI